MRRSAGRLAPLLRLELCIGASYLSHKFCTGLHACQNCWCGSNGSLCGLHAPRDSEGTCVTHLGAKSRTSNLLYRGSSCSNSNRADKRTENLSRSSTCNEKLGRGDHPFIHVLSTQCRRLRISSCRPSTEERAPSSLDYMPSHILQLYYKY